jgi:uncharacterized membrane protein YphA (DoxX/SURF4 family)
LRAAIAISPIQHGIEEVLAAPAPALFLVQLVAACSGALLLLGFWTPVAGVLMALSEIGLAFMHSHDPWIHILLGALGASLAMLGPGAWSLDARRFGRKRIQIPQR